MIDTVLTLPSKASETLLDFGLTSLRGALLNASLVDAVDNTPNLTIFAPNNEAFQNIGSALPNLTAEQVTDILTYHVVASMGEDMPIGYSSNLMNGTELTTLQGETLTVYVSDEGIFVNNAKVTVADVLIANGVVHVIDEVLNPTNKTQGSGDEGEPAFEGASSVSEAPFTSGQTATTTIAGARTSAANPTASMSSTAGAPIQTAAVGISALIGAAAVYFL